MSFLYIRNHGHIPSPVLLPHTNNSKFKLDREFIGKSPIYGIGSPSKKYQDISPTCVETFIVYTPTPKSYRQFFDHALQLAFHLVNLVGWMGKYVHLQIQKDIVRFKHESKSKSKTISHNTSQEASHVALWSESLQRGPLENSASDNRERSIRKHNKLV